MNVFKFRKKAEGENRVGLMDKVGGRESVVTVVKDVVAGDILLKETIRKQYLYVLLLFVLSLFYVNNKFLYERELREIERKWAEVTDLRYRSLSMSKEVKQAGRRSAVVRVLEEKGSVLKSSMKPVVIIED